MKLSLKINIFMSAVAAAICIGIALNGFASLGDIVEAGQRADAVGFAWFWMFIGLVCALFCAVGWWWLRTQKDE